MPPQPTDYGLKIAMEMLHERESRVRARFRFVRLPRVLGVGSSTAEPVTAEQTELALTLLRLARRGRAQLDPCHALLRVSRRPQRSSIHATPFSD
jgi:hypothetical protein